MSDIVKGEDMGPTIHKIQVYGVIWVDISRLLARYYLPHIVERHCDYRSLAYTDIGWGYRRMRYGKKQLRGMRIKASTSMT